jgi:threonine/homoserine/homoserine lactone efflux protein
MNSLKRIAGINLAILLGYSILARLIDNQPGHSKGLGFMIFMVMFVALHVLVNLIICLFHFSRRNKDLGRSYLLSGLIVAVIGFSACFGLAGTY